MSGERINRRQKDISRLLRQRRQDCKAKIKASKSFKNHP
jgi:hypothetical protein